MKHVASLAVFLLALCPGPAKACFAGSGPNAGLRAVQGSAVIVRAKAMEYATRFVDHGGVVRFHVSEVLRGEAPSEIFLGGDLIDQDDFNDRPVPYNYVRHDGRSGTCFASQYRPGAEYLLMLSYSDGSHVLGLSMFPLAPVNEELHSPRDPWLLWVRRQTKVTKQPTR